MYCAPPDIPILPFFNDTATTEIYTLSLHDALPICRLSNMGKVFINGKAYNQIGRICMDVCMADVTGGDVRQGDEAILFGRGGMSIEDVAQIVGTINYELTCLVTERANRVYVNN